jgi:hypothetical protein
LVLGASSIVLAEARSDDKNVIVKRQDQEVMRYRHGGEIIKPYVEYLTTPAGVNVLRDSPFDHKHHHGLMFAVAVDDVNFWEEREPCGHEVGQVAPTVVGEGRKPRKNKKASLGVRGGLKQNIDWVGPKDAKPLLNEKRSVVVNRVADDKATLLTWQTELSLPPGKTSAKIAGNPYYGLGMRFVVSMDKDGRFVNADGKTGVKETNKARSKWCAYSATADGKPVTVAMFDHPKNFRHAATWFTMDKPFAYLSATLDLKNQPVEMLPGKTLPLRYGVAVWDGSPTSAEIDKLYETWVAIPVVDRDRSTTKPAK